MAVLALGAVGSAVGGSLFGGATLFGLSGAAIGGAVGSLVGGLVDQAIFGKDVKTEGPRLSDVNFMASSEGATILRVLGKMRVNPQVIWATRFKETSKTDDVGGKGGPSVKTTEYFYSASFALGLCEGPIIGVARVWADGKLISLGDYNTRLYFGTEDQEPDPKIVAVEGADKVSGYRGLAYLVFEDLPLERFGNRVPQITVEVIVRPDAGEGLEALLHGVTLIPGSTEFGYARTKVTAQVEGGESKGENTHASETRSDFVVAIDLLQAEAPAVEHVALVVAWHGTDLRVGQCKIWPKVETRDKTTRPFTWRVGGLTRDETELVSQIGGAPAIGGAPSDRSVYEAIQELKARGLKVTLYPFIIMDVAADNDLPDPYGGDRQAAYPWRGRITCHPAPGRPGSPDGTAAVADDVAAFFGDAEPGDFGWEDESLRVTFDGSETDRSYRRFILHLAKIAQEAGGVDAFLIGSEMVGLTTVRSGATSYPAVGRLKALAADVRAMLPDAELGYAADWSEYHSHRPSDGSGDVIFHLDPLWADANIDFVGVDNYLPLADWRDGSQHLDAVAGAPSIYDAGYLTANVEGGEYFEWYYASSTDREAQLRTPIVDTAHGEHWVFRQKDFRSWWSQAHHDRPGGIRSGSATAWIPQSKRIVFTELGCPAIDKGANQPNVFVDPKSSESFTPYFSSGQRDDLMQRSMLEAALDYWRPAHGRNPVSGVTGDRMIDVSRITVWTWDARPYPEFPQLSDLWADAPNWRLGHWLNGRLNLIRLSEAVEAIAGGAGVAIDASALHGALGGYLADGLSTARGELEPLRSVFFFDAVATGGLVRFVHRGRQEPVAIDVDDLVPANDDKGAFEITRAQESELPRARRLRFYSPDADYRMGVVESRRLTGSTAAIVDEQAPVALPYGRARGVVEAMLFQDHVARERARFVLPPVALALDPTDVVALSVGGRVMRLRIEEIGFEHVRPVSAVREEPAVYDLEDGPDVRRVTPRPQAPAQPDLYFLDIPLLEDDDERPWAPRLAAYSAPWQPVSVYRRRGSTTTLDSEVRVAAAVGVTTEPLLRGPVGRWDRTSVLTVEVGRGVSLASAEEIDVLNGANIAAVEVGAGSWEIMQWRDATLIGPRTFELTNLLRGQRGSDADMVDEAAAGAAFVILNGAVKAASMASTLLDVELRWIWGPSSLPTTDELYDKADLTVRGVGLRPYAPVHLRAERAGGDIALSWIRRTRRGGDAWSSAEVPLAEDTEAYVVRVLDGAAVKRTIDATSPAATYDAAAQAADFGGAISTITFDVAQVSAQWGVGPRTAATLSLGA
jgi:hypothetical protein